MIFWILTGLFLIFCSYTDIRYKKISIVPPVIYTAAGIAVSSNSILHSSLACVVTSLGICAFMFIVSIASRGGIAVGDCILISALACCMMPYYVISIILYGFIFSGLTSLFLIAVKKKSKKDTLPFAPFLLAGYICCLIVIYI